MTNLVPAVLPSTDIPTRRDSAPVMDDAPQRDRSRVAAALCLLTALGLSGCEAFAPPPLPVSFFPAPAPPPPPVRSEPRTRGGVQAEIIRWFSAHGYRQPQVYALVDYVRMESNFNPCITNGNSYKYTFQWGAERLERLASFTGTRSCPPLDKQLAFADHELRTNGNYSCFFYAATRSEALTALRRGFGYGRC